MNVEAKKRASFPVGSAPLIEKQGLHSSAGYPSLKRRDLCWMFAFIVLGFSLRLLLLIGEKGILDADESIVGLMAKHINEGRPWPIFYYGQPYMGSLEAIFAALSFRMLGMSGVALKAVPLFFSLIHIGLVYVLARRFINMRAAMVAGLLTAVAPAGLVDWSTMARGGFIELVVMGTLAFILAVDILRTERPAASRFLVLGVVLGLGWWTNNQMIFYLVPLAGVFLLWFGKYYRVTEALRWAGLVAAGFFTGSAPFWYYNIAETPRWQTFDVLTRQQSQTGFSDHLAGFFTEALPIILGARRFWSATDIFPYSTALTYSLYALALGVFLFRIFHGGTGGTTGAESLRSRRASGLLIVFFLVAVPLIFSASSFGWLSRAPRYLLPLYTVLFVIVGGAADTIWRRGNVVSRLSAFLLVASLAGIHLASNLAGGLAVPGQPFVANGERVATDQRPLYRFLAEEHYDHVWTNYWIGYRLAFETAERVTFSIYGEPRTMRIPEYEQKAALAFGNEVYVLVPSQVGELGGILNRLGYAYRSTRAGEYIVVDNIHPETEWGDPLPIRADQMKTTSRGEWAGRMVDHDSTTRWGSGTPQVPGMGVEVWFDGETDVAGLELDHGQFLTDLPKHLVVLGLLADGSWCELVDMGGIDVRDALQRAEGDRTPRVLNLHFSPRRIRALHLEQRDQGAGPFDWSIAELRVHPPLR